MDTNYTFSRPNLEYLKNNYNVSYEEAQLLFRTCKIYTLDPYINDFNNIFRKREVPTFVKSKTIAILDPYVLEEINKDLPSEMELLTDENGEWYTIKTKGEKEMIKNKHFVHSQLRYKYGKLGGLVPHHLHNLSQDLNIGDVIAFEYDNRILVKTVLHDEKNDTYGVWGLGIRGLKYENMSIVYKYNEISNQNMLKFTDNKMKVEVSETKELTLSEIERLLGYEIILKGEK